MTSAPFERGRIAAWCIVPYDTAGRGPRERADMLVRLGLAGEVWDWRDEHVAQFPAELDALAARDLRMYGLWIPHVVPPSGDLGTVSHEARSFIDELGSRALAADLFACLEFGAPGSVPPLPPADHVSRVARAADHVEPLAALAADAGLRVALYNHLGWSGEPENQIEIIDALGARGVTNVGIVYQQHHGHHHMHRWDELFPRMAPYLYTLGINGMVPGQHWGGSKIHPYGRGPSDVDLLRVVAESEWDGLVTILCHTMDDAQERLLDNLDGLEWALAQLRGEDGALPDARIPEPVWPH